MHNNLSHSESLSVDEATCYGSFNDSGSYSLSIFHMPRTVLDSGARRVKIKDKYPCPCGLYSLEGKKQTIYKVNK